jgi:hypothetical protein
VLSVLTRILLSVQQPLSIDTSPRQLFTQIKNHVNRGFYFDGLSVE